MNTKHAFRRAALTLAGAGLLAPQSILMAAGPVGSTTVPAIQSASIRDVSLTQAGSLRGQVVDSQGVALASTTVKVQSAGREIASTTTNEQGEFTFNDLRGGNYTINAGDSTGVYRVWTANAAPPAAKQGLLLVSRRQTARGQGIAGMGSRTGIIVLGAAAGIVTAGVTANNDNDSSS
jgi:hypothetical protein